MKKKTITMVIVFLLAVVAIIIIGFFGKKILKQEKEYSTDYLTFKSSEALIPKTLDGFDIYFENLNNNIFILGRHEDKEELSKMGFEISSLKDYAQAVYNKREEDVIGKLESSDNFYYFTYKYSTDSSNVFYLGAMYENKNDFWTINFACDYSEKDKYESEFIKWARSIKFKESNK